MAKEIDVRQGGVFKTIPFDQVFVRQGSKLQPVVSILVRQGKNWGVVLDYTPGKPGNLRKDDASGSQDYTSITLTWNTPPDGFSPEQYRILVRPDGARQSTTADVVRVLDKTRDDTSFSARTWKVTGLKPKTGYIFTVQAVNLPWKSDPSLEVRGQESNPLRVYTGQKELQVHGSSRHQIADDEDKDKIGEWINYYEFQPDRADTYTKSKLWETTRNRPAQGTYDGSNVEGRNRYGCIEYSGIYSRLVKLHGSVETDNGPVKIADKVNITSAKLQTIGRVNDNQGGTPTLKLHNGFFSIGTDVVPNISETKDVTAPRENDVLDHEVVIDKGWAQNWAKPSSSRRWNGIVIYRSDGNAQCVLAGADEDGMNSSWDLRLEYDWDITTRSQINYTNDPNYVWPV